MDYSIPSNYNTKYYIGYHGQTKRQIVDQTLNQLHNMQMDMIEAAVNAKEYQGFPEANALLNYIKAL